VRSTDTNRFITFEDFTKRILLPRIHSAAKREIKAAGAVPAARPQLCGYKQLDRDR
jgi:hypothetical protein